MHEWSMSLYVKDGLNTVVNRSVQLKFQANSCDKTNKLRIFRMQLFGAKILSALWISKVSNILWVEIHNSVWREQSVPSI